MMKLNTLTARLRQLWMPGLTLAASTLVFPVLAADSNNPALAALFDQANYWHQKAHDDLARASLNKVLMVDSNNTQALYLMALWSQQSGDNAAAAKWRACLSQVSPQDPHLSELDNARQLQSIPTAQLTLARQQARAGNISASLQTWRNTFSGNEPPASVAAEYYLTMAGDRTLLPQAIDNLRDFAARHPQDTGAKLALGKALTWQESTRREGLQVLEGMADGNPDADRSLRQALLWLGPQPGDAPMYQHYQQRHPQDRTLLTSLPDSVRESVTPRPTATSDPLRRQAKQALAAGNTAQAVALLQQGIQRFPTDGWVRLDLARIYQKQGNTNMAAGIMQPAFRQGASSNEIYAAALFASESGAWQQAQTLLARVPARNHNSDMRELSRRVNFNLQMAVAQQYLAQGSNVAAANTLKALAVNPPENPADAGNLAKGLAAAGDLTTAVSVVRSNMQRGVQGNAGDYAAQVAVLNQAGLSGEAQNFLSNPELQSRSTPTQLAGVQNGYVINEADRLRNQGQYAAAYDKLIGALQHDPQNTDLMFAMGRLYQSGKMNKEAGVVYDYLMTRDTPTQDARVGAIDVALANHDLPKAKMLTAGLRGEQTPDRLLLMARVAKADGDHQQALAYLRTARGKMIGLEGATTGSTPDIGGMALADNPFINRTTLGVRRSPSAYGTVMPWQQTPAGGDTATQTASVDVPILHQIDTMMDDLQERTGTWAQGGVQVRGRDGESGLSKLTEAKAPLTWSTVPYGDTRFDFTLTPVTLSAGSASGTSISRFGTQALEQGRIAQANAIARAAEFSGFSECVRC